MAESESNTRNWSRAKDSIGVRYGRLTVLSFFRNNGSTVANCLCDCGAPKTANLNAIKRGKIHSCGCIKKAGLRTTHGDSRRDGKSLEYRIWCAMRERCSNPHNKKFADYGGRGIKVCERWDRFDNFLADMGRKPTAGHSIDRYPSNDGNYEPSNCRWATSLEQGQNKRNNHLLSFGGETLTMAAWARRLGCTNTALIARINSGWSVERTLTERGRIGR